MENFKAARVTKGSKKKERTQIMKCNKCKEDKPVEEFYNDSLQCISCVSKLKLQSAEKLRDIFLHECVKENLIMIDEMHAAKLLLLSCESRFYACKYDKGIYKDVTCDFNSPRHFFKECLKLDGFFNEWEKLTFVYEYSQNDDDRPVIDRVNPKGDYTLDNIRPLPNIINRKLANSKPILFLLWKRQGLKDVVRGRFESIADVKRYFQNSNNIYLPLNVNVDSLVNKAIKIGSANECDPFEFNYNGNRYLVQILFAQDGHK